MWESVMGPSENKAAFESSLKSYQQGSKHGKTEHGRLQSFNTIMQSYPGDLFVGQFYPGGQVQMEGIFDSATDMIAIQGMWCSECEG